MAKSRVEALGEIQRRLLRHAGEDLPRVEFFSSVMDTVLAFLPCTVATLMVRHASGVTTWTADARSKARVQIVEGDARQGSGRESESSLARLCWSVLMNETARPKTRRGRPGTVFVDQGSLSRPGQRPCTCSVVVAPFEVGAEARMGVLGAVRSRTAGFDEEEVRFFEAVVDAVAVAIAHQRVKWALRERVKELTCLCGISRVAETPNLSETEALQRIVELLPPGWQYPGITSATIVLDGREVAVCGSRQGSAKQVADVMVRGERRGYLEIVYRKESPDFDEGPKYSCPSSRPRT